MKKIFILLALLILFLHGKGQTTTFSYTGSLQYYTVPSGVSSVTIVSKGAQGGGDTYISATGGTGAIITGTFAVTTGQVLAVMVGGQGTTAQYVGGGGGGSFVWDNSTSTLYIAAGGGGGAGVNWPSSAINGIAGSTTTSGTNGGGGMSSGAGTGGYGGVAPTGYVDWAAGGAGWLSAGNNGTLEFCTYNSIGGSTPLSGGAGGSGGGDYPNNAPGGYGGGGGGNARCGAIGGGGGGGYSGGGAGAETSYADYFPSGGGGGSYNIGTSTSATTGNTGNGSVTITVSSCSGTPTAGTISATATTGCGTYTSTLSLTGASGGGGTTYQWKSSPDGSTWTTVAGATNSTYTATVTANVYYECIITCTTSGSSATTSSIELYYYTSPAAITGSTSVCPGTTITLGDATSGGSWSSGTTSVATVNPSTGVVTGISSSGGTATITYTAIGGCYVTTTVSVTSGPPAIGGTLSACAGSTTTLSDASSGGTWSSSMTSVASVGVTGVIYAFSSGTTTITYSLGSTCTAIAVVTVYTTPASITGTAYVCTGATTTLADPTTGGTWSSASGGTASVVSTSGVVTGTGAGTTTISYIMPGSCYAVIPVTVNATPPGIGGSTVVCAGSTTTLTDATGGGTWSSSSTYTGTISGTGSFTGLHAGTTTVSYTMSTGCYTTITETVDSLPSPITGINNVCVASTTMLTDAGTGTWTSSASGIASAGLTTGAISGASPGTATITYTLSSGCYTTMPFTVNALPAVILGNTPVCIGATITLSDATGGGSWSMGGTRATIGTGTGIVTGDTAGTVTAAYTLSTTGCSRTAIVTVNPLPTAIAGYTTICLGSTTTLSDATGGGTWSASNTSISPIGAGTGAITGSSVGIDTVAYTVTATGCKTIVRFTVQSPPSAITGTPSFCTGSSTTYSDAVSGGIWLSSTPTIAIADSFTGRITSAGATGGTSVISYMLGTCYATRTVTVNTTPSGIGGIGVICSGGATLSLTDATTGGTWSSSASSIATIDPVSGVLTSNGVGSALVSYTITSTGCFTSSPIIVSPLPSAITGNDTLCLGATGTLYDGAAGGSFSSGAPSIANINASTGVVSGVAAGTTYITYTLAVGSGCYATMPFAVLTQVAVSTTISGSPGDTICSGNSITYTASTINGGSNPAYTWYVNGYAVSGVTGDTYTYVPNNGDVIKCGVASNMACPAPTFATSNSIDMTVIPVTHPTVVMTPTSQDTMCTGTVVTFNVTSTLGGTSPAYLWTVNWMPVAAGTTSYTYSPANGDIVRCGMASSSPCPVPDTAFAIDTLVVQTYDTPAVHVFGVQSCQGNNATLVANPTNGGTSPQYFWSVNGGGAMAGGAEYNYSPKDSDVIRCMMISNYHCPVPRDTTYATAIVTVDPIIQVTVKDSRGGLLDIWATDTFTAVVENGGGAPGYQWYKNGIIIPWATTYELVLNQLKNKDSISCVVTTGSGTACEYIKGHNWLIVEVAPASVAIVGDDLNNVTLVPNPNAGDFVVDGTLKAGSSRINYLVTDIIGQVVYNESANTTGNILHHKFELGKNLAEGIYFLHISTDQGSSVLRFELKR